MNENLRSLILKYVDKFEIHEPKQDGVVVLQTEKKDQQLLDAVYDWFYHNISAPLCPSRVEWEPLIRSK